MSTRQATARRRAVAGAAVAAGLALVAPSPSDVLLDIVFVERSSGSVALGRDGEHIEVLIGVCDVQPEVVHLTYIRAASPDKPDLATWSTPSGLGEGVSRLSARLALPTQIPRGEAVPVPARSVRAWVEPEDGDSTIPFTEATPSQLESLADDEVLTRDVNGEPLVMTKPEYRADHCLGASDGGRASSAHVHGVGARPVGYPPE